MTALSRRNEIGVNEMSGDDHFKLKWHQMIC